MCCCLKGGKTKRPCNICDEEHKHMHKLKPQEEPNARSILQLRPYFEECRAFETIKKELASMRDLKQITKARYETLLKDARDAWQSKQDLLARFSAHGVEPAFSELGYLDPYQAMTIDLMHLLDLGLIPRMLLLTAKHWHTKRKAQGGLNELNDMWLGVATNASSKPDDVRRILGTPLFKKDKNKIEIASVPKAEEYRAILQIFPHLVVAEATVHAVWVALNDFYVKAHEGCFTTDTIIELDAAALRWLAPLSMLTLLPLAPCAWLPRSRLEGVFVCLCPGCKRPSRSRR